MRIALVHAYSWPEVRRGAERYLADLSAYLIGAGHQVEVITGDAHRSSVAEVDGVLVHRRQFVAAQRMQGYGLSPLDGFGLTALPVLLRHRYDVVHALNPSAAVAGRLAGQRPVYTVLGHPTIDSLRDRPQQRRLLRAAVRAASAVTTLSRSARSALRDLTGIDADVLPPGVRPAEFAPRLAPRTGPPRVLFVSDADDDRKGAALLLRAFAEVLRTRPDATLVHAGPGSLRRRLTEARPAADDIAAAIEEPGVGDIAQLPATYRSATLTVLPARDEAFGLVLVESLACGTPVVAVAGSGPSDIVDDPSIGALAPDDPAALARAILRTADLAADPETAQRCAEHARRWDWEANIGPAHEAVYRRIARRGGA